MLTQSWMRANMAMFIRTLWIRRGVSKRFPNQKIILSVFARRSARHT
jgi:hypothetical protein